MAGSSRPRAEASAVDRRRAVSRASAAKSGESPPPAAPIGLDGGLQVDPVRIGGRRSLGPVLLLAAVTAFVGAAVLKPWDGDLRPEPRSGRQERLENLWNRFV